MKTNTGYNLCNDAFSAGSEKVYADFNREEAEQLTVDELFNIMYNRADIIKSAETNGADKIEVFEFAVGMTSSFLSGGEEMFEKGGTILAAENVDIVSVMGTGISTLRTTYARLDGKIFRIKWEQASQFAKWEYWLSLTYALRRAGGDPEKLLDKNFV